MPKDYANRKQKTKASRTKNQVSTLRWTITIIFLIFFILTLSYLKTHTHVNKQNKVQSKHTKPAMSASQEASFDFYTILPKMKVSSSSLPTAVEKEPKKTSYFYLVQLAAFKKYQDADKFKAEMTLQGFIVKIVKNNTKNNLIIYRVFLGPYRNQQLALNMQSQLAKMHLKPLLIKINPNQGPIKVE